MTTQKSPWNELGMRDEDLQRIKDALPSWTPDDARALAGAYLRALSDATNQFVEGKRARQIRENPESANLKDVKWLIERLSHVWGLLRIQARESLAQDYLDELLGAEDPFEAIAWYWDKQADALVDAAATLRSGSLGPALESIQVQFHWMLMAEAMLDRLRRKSLPVCSCFHADLLREEEPELAKAIADGQRNLRDAVMGMQSPQAIPKT